MRKQKYGLIVFVIPGLLSTLHGSEIDEEYSQYLRNPRLIMNLSASKRKEVSEWIGEYKEKTVFACAAKVQKEKANVKKAGLQRQQLVVSIEQEKINYSFYLRELSAAQERWQELTAEKVTLQQELEEMLRKATRDRHHEQMTYLEEEARNHREERGWFGFLGDAIWGRDIKQDQVVSLVKENRDKEIVLHKSKIAFIERKLESNAERRTIAEFNIRESSTKINSLEVSLFGGVKGRK